MGETWLILNKCSYLHKPNLGVEDFLVTGYLLLVKRRCQHVSQVDWGIPNSHKYNSYKELLKVSD